MLLRLFIDEVGNSDLKGAATDPNVRYLSLTGIVAIKEQHERIITPAFARLKSILRQPEDGSPILFHRREMVRREGIFAQLRDASLAAKFDASLMAFFTESPYLVTTVQIDKFEHLEKYTEWHFDPYHYCLRCLVERFVLYLRRHQSRGDVIIEPRYKLADKKVKSSFEKIYDQGTENISGTIVQRHLISRDIQFFPKKANIAGLQMADLIGHPSARQMRHARDGNAPLDDFGARIASLLLAKKYARCPKKGTINGWGTKWLP